MWLSLECLIQTFLVFETLIVSFSTIKNFFSGKSVLTVAYSWHRPRAPKLQSRCCLTLPLSSCLWFPFCVLAIQIAERLCFPFWRIGAMFLCLLTSWLLVHLGIKFWTIFGVFNVLLVPSWFCFFTFNICLFFFWTVLMTSVVKSLISAVLCCLV